MHEPNDSTGSRRERSRFEATLSKATFGSESLAGKSTGSNHAKRKKIPFLFREFVKLRDVRNWWRKPIQEKRKRHTRGLSDTVNSISGLIWGQLSYREFAFCSVLYVGSGKWQIVCLRHLEPSPYVAHTQVYTGNLPVYPAFPISHPTVGVHLRLRALNSLSFIFPKPSPSIRRARPVRSRSPSPRSRAPWRASPPDCAESIDVRGGSAFERFGRCAARSETCETPT